MVMKRHPSGCAANARTPARMRPWVAVLAGVLFLTTSAAASTRSAPAPETRPGQALHWSWTIPAGKAIEIKGVNGGIEAVRAAGHEVEVEATKRANRSDPDEVTVEVIEHADGITLCVKYPAPFGKENECAPGDKGRMSTHDNDVQVSFKVRVPAGVRLIARTVNGGIEADGLQGAVEAATVNGSVRVATSSYARAETVNGSIVASLGSVAWPAPLWFNTVNGDIRITLPANLDSDIRAETMNGRIKTDFPVTVRGRFSRRRMQGTIGRGGPRLEIETVNGSVELRSAP